MPPGVAGSGASGSGAGGRPQDETARAAPRPPPRPVPRDAADQRWRRDQPGGGARRAKKRPARLIATLSCHHAPSAAPRSATLAGRRVRRQPFGSRRGGQEMSSLRRGRIASSLEFGPRRFLSSTATSQRRTLGDLMNSYVLL